jgi:hypothetical protein
VASQEQIDSFYQFATDHLAREGSKTSIDELYDQWRFENLNPEELSENVAAVQSAIDDMLGGDMGRDAGAVERELREELKIPTSE